MKRVLSPTLALALSQLLSIGGICGPPSEDLCAASTCSRSEQPLFVERGIVALDQALREVSNPYSVMCLSAGPRDVDWGTLAYYHKRLGGRAVVVLATRDEARAINSRSTLAFAAGELNTDRALEAARIVGADVYFLDLPDSLQASSPDEWLGMWGNDEALGRVVRAFRLLRPDIVITNPNSTTDRSRSQAVARLAIEAFEASADTKRFPEVVSKSWQVRRLFEQTDRANAEVTVDLSEYDHTRAVRYQQIGATAESANNTEKPTLQSPSVYYKLVRSSSGEHLQPGSSLISGLTLPDNLARSLAAPQVAGLPLTEAINKREALVDALVEKLLEKRAEGPPEELYNRYGAEFFRVIRFREVLERAIALALGLEFRVVLSDDVLIAGQKLKARLAFSNGGSRRVPVVFRTPESISEEPAKTTFRASEQASAGPNESIARELEYELPQNAAITLPHSEHLQERNYYPLGSTYPGAEPARTFGNDLVAFAEIGVAQTSISIAAGARYDIVPPVEISTEPSFAFVRDLAAPRDMELTVRLRNRTPGPLGGELWVVPLALTSDRYRPDPIAFGEEDEEITVSLKLKVPILEPPLASDVLVEFRRPKPAPSEPLASAKISVIQADIQRADRVIVGLLSEPNSETAAGLAQLDIETVNLSLDSLRAHQHGDIADGSSTGCSELSLYDSIVVDRLAVGSSHFTLGMRKCLLDYVRHGGNLVILEHDCDGSSASSEELPLAPFDIRLSEAQGKSLVKVLGAGSPLLTKPNAISRQEIEHLTPAQATCSPNQWAGDYVSVVELTGANQDPKRSALLTSRSGDGQFVYTTLDLERRMLAADPAAYRLLANLVAWKRPHKDRWNDEW